MKIRNFTLVGLVGLALAGCQTDPNQVLLEQENFKQQNEIYRLRNELEDCQAALQAARCQTAPRGPAPSAPAAEQGPATTPPPATLPSEQFGPPPVEMPKEPLPEGQIPERFRTHGDSGNSGGSAPPSTAAPKSDAPSWNGSSRASPVDSSRTAQITLNPALTAGYAAAGSPGQQGVVVVIEPRDARGRLLDAPADIQVVALDPALTGQEARVARWDVTAAEAAARIDGGPERGIHLRLPWPDRTPAHNKLHLFVRYLTSDGRRLQADGLVEVALPAAGPGGWTPAPRGAAEPSDEAASPGAPPREEPSPRTASELSDPGPRRPVWSPGADVRALR